MVQNIEVSDSNNGCSIRVGTTGTIGSLMIKELESMKISNPQQTSMPNRRRSPTNPVSVLCGGVGYKQQPLKPGTSTGSSQRSPANKTPQKPNRKTQKFPKNNPKAEHHIPMLSSDAATDSQCYRKKSNKKTLASSSTSDSASSYGASCSSSGSFIVEVVDLKCSSSSPDKIWAAPITSRLRKLSFSRLSNTV
ncbi:hypothetical protein AMTR_s00062p00091110 [Amborella trichopoda]|uniref:Uncharacterized protein n=2 Tax=Amborella trichopoda TaxID=13333 RepID=U5DGM1_AMBTC|nr:hypothetical protein AMTR_s00062p00091110 [Amborella trichopoda]